MDRNVIEVKNLKYRYPNTTKLAIDDISFTIDRGEFIGIIGRSGCGKSTLVQALNGLVPRFYRGAFGGKAFVCGKLADETDVWEMCEKIGLVFQNPFTQLSGSVETVYDEIGFGLQNLGIEREEMLLRIESVMRELGIWQYRDKNPFELSGGQMQRVAIASILVMRPEIVVFDEPTSQLDPRASRNVFDIARGLKEAGITVLIISHKMEILANYCDRIMLLNDGKLVDFDTPKRIFSRDDLESFGINAPIYTRMARDYNLKNADGTYPITIDEAVSLFKANSVSISDNTLEPCSKFEDIFKVSKLKFSYKNSSQIFDGLNLELDSRSLAIIGENGAGKTTLVRLLKGLIKPIAGNIYFMGEDIGKKSVAMLAGEVGYVFQNPDDQIFSESVLDEVMFGPIKLSMSDAQRRAIKALEMVGLYDKAQLNPYDLDLSDRKLIAIASVIAMDTEVIILDEPTIAQDYMGRRKISEIIKKLSNEGKTVIAILHDMDFVLENFDRVIVMAHGNILMDDSAENVFKGDDILSQAGLMKPYITEFCGEVNGY